MRRYISALGVMVASWASVAQSQPVIERLNFTDDGYLEIHGSNFGSKNPVKPLVWLDFESSTPASLSRYEGAKVNGTSTNDPANSGNRVLSFDAKSSRDSGGPASVKFESDTLYVNLRRNYRFQINSSALHDPSGGLNLKIFRIWASFDAPNNNNMYLGYQGKEGVNSGRIVGEGTDDKTNWLGTSGTHVGLQWVNEELIYKSSRVDVSDGIFQFVKDGVFAKSEGERNRTSSKSMRYTHLVLDQVSNYSLSASLPILYDDIYIDDTYSRVVITDSSTASGYKRSVPQIPVEWRQDYIKVKLHTAERGDKEFYVYVYNNNNASNAKGIRVCPKCPKAPAI